MSIALTIVWEAVVACHLLKSCQSDRVIKSVVYANLFFFFSVFMIGAILAWPERMKHKNWLLQPPR